MKIRTGFVSNSSSSSFMCSVCGRIEAGRDMSLGECEMWQCKNGHYIHDDCVDKDSLEPFFIEYIKEYIEKYGENHHYNIKNEARYEIPAEYCPICSFKKLSKEDELAFYRWKMGFPKKDVLKSISEEFTNYIEFKKKIYQ